MTAFVNATQIASQEPSNATADAFAESLQSTESLLLPFLSTFALISDPVASTIFATDSRNQVSLQNAINLVVTVFSFTNNMTGFSDSFSDPTFIANVTATINDVIAAANRTTAELSTTTPLPTDY